MNTNATIAYDALVSSGKVKGIKLSVYRLIAQYPEPSTAGEIIHDYKEGHDGLGFGDTPMNSISPRFAELEQMGVIRRAGERICRVTKRLAIVWEITGNQPKALDRSRARGMSAVLQQERDQWQAEANELRKECATKALEIEELKKQLAKWGRPPNSVRRERASRDNVQEFTCIVARNGLHVIHEDKDRDDSRPENGADCGTGETRNGRSCPSSDKSSVPDAGCNANLTDGTGRGNDGGNQP